MAMVDRHRQHPGDAPGKGHYSIPGGPDPASESGGQIETPVPCIGACRFINAHQPPGNGGLQAQGNGQFEKHISTSPPAARSTYQSENVRRTPLLRPGQRPLPVTSGLRNAKDLG
jgi:hypothetical protein